MKRKNDEPDPSDQPNQNDDSPELTREKAEEQAGMTEEFEARMKKIRKDVNDLINGKGDNAEKKKVIKTKTFGRGFDGWDDE